MKVMQRKDLETGISLHTDPAGEHGSGLIYQGLSEMDKQGRLSSWELCEGNLDGGLLYWRP